MVNADEMGRIDARFYVDAQSGRPDSWRRGCGREVFLSRVADNVP
jgi:hypothetical protein